MDAWTGWVLRHRLIVVLFWVAIAVAGGVLAPRTADALTYEFGLPNQPAYEANQQIVEASGGGGDNDPIVLYGAADATLEQRVAAVAAAVPGTRYISPATGGGDGLLSDDKQNAVALLYPPVVPGPDPYAAALPAINAVAGQPDIGLAVTGVAILSEDSGGSDRGVLFETIIGGVGALIVLALVFGSLLAAVPLLIAAVSILAAFLCLLGLTALTDVIFVVEYLVALIGLGVAIDYSLLIVMRWREECSHGVPSREAVRIAMATAGRSVIFSGVTVAVSLAALIAVPLPFLRSVGLAGLLIPLLSVATALSLVPVLLATLGTRLQWPRRRAIDPTSRSWQRIAAAVVRRPVPVAILSSALLLALAVPLLGLRLGSPEFTAYDDSTPAGAAASSLLADGIPAGVLRPVEVLAPPSAADQLNAELADVDGIANAVAPTGAGWSTSDGQLLQVWTAADPATSEGAATVEAARSVVPIENGYWVGGSAAEDADLVGAIYGNAPLVAAIIIVVTLVLLARALRSLWLPVKALVLNVLSLAAAYGITVLIWQYGIGSELLFDSTGSGAIVTWIPIAAFAFLFGLSMDYEVFILARMREAYDEHGSTSQAVIDGIARTGRLVTSAALILFLAFVALSTVPAVEVKILATALAFGILIDAVIVRALLAPALVVLLGRYNWTLPPSVARLLRVPVST